MEKKEEQQFNPFIMFEEEKSDFNLREFINFFWRLRFWIIGAMVVAFTVAFFYLKMTNRVYVRSASVLLNNENTSGNSEMDIISDLTGRASKSNVENEVFILKSPSLMRQVVDELGLDYKYFQYRMPVFASSKNVFRKFLNIKKYEFYGDSPFRFNVTFDPLYPTGMLPGYVYLEISVVDDSSFKIKKLMLDSDEVKEQSKKVYDFSQKVPVGGVEFSVEKVSTSSLFTGDDYVVSWSDSYAVAKSLSTALTVTNVGTRTARTDVIELSIEDSKTARAEDILNTLIVKYNIEARDYKNQASQNTINFIKVRLDSISRTLGNVETDYRNYQSSNTLVNLEAQSQLTLSSDMQYENQLNEVRLQQNILKMIKDEMTGGEKEFKVIPSNIGVADNGLNSVISNYNLLVAERNRMIANSSENNPRVLNVTEQLRDGRHSIELTIDNLEKVYKIRENELNSVLRSSKKKMLSIPTQQLDLQQISRKQEIIEPLYRLLQQKLEEAQITLYASTDNVRVIESAYGAPDPIKPKNSMVYLIALMLGFFLPPLFMWSRNVLKSKVETKEDITKVIKVPILSTIPMNKEGGVLLTSSGGRDVTSESFRMLRSNLQFLQGSVIQVTSSVPGEGKSYIASNLAISLSHVGKRVALIGLDLRKPVLQKYFKENKDDIHNTVVGYLIGKCDSPELLPSQYKDTTLDLIFAGSVPPNPSELLSLERFAALMEWVRGKYDYVICDTAPYMPVSDAVLVNKFVDQTVYVIRSEYTDLKLLSEIQNAVDDKRLKGVNIVLNGMDLEAGKYKYGYGYGYGYRRGYGGYGGYGYGYGYGYGTDEQGKKKHHHHHHHTDKKKE